MRIIDRNDKAVSIIENIDLRITDQLSKLSTIGFSVYNAEESSSLIKEDYKIETEDNIYIIKKLNREKTITRYEGVQCVEEIKAKGFVSGVELIETDIITAVRFILAETRWTVIDDGTEKRKRTLRAEKTKNAFDVLQDAIKLWKVEIKYDSKNKQVRIKDKYQNDLGVYFSDEINLVSNSVQVDTSELKTRLYPIGKDGLTIESVNNGKKYIDNFGYTDRIIELVWEDNRYTVVDNLLADGKKKLEELSKPKYSYELKVVDLAAINKEYDFLKVEIGDIATIIDSKIGIKDSQRVVSLTRYPNNPHKNEIKLANTRRTFADIQQEQDALAGTVDTVTTDTGLDGSKVDQITTDQIKDFDKIAGNIIEVDKVIANLIEADKILAGEIEAGKITVGEIVANLGNFDELHAGLIQADKVITGNIEAITGQIGVLEGDLAQIDSIVSGNISSENIQTGGITGDRLNMSTIFVDDANILSVNANKIKAGSIDTNLVNIKSEDGSMTLQGSTQQFKDKNGNVRLQLGKDARGDFNFILRGTDGKSTLIDHTGIKEGAITDDLINSNMIAPDVVGEKQIDYSSFATGFNKDTNTTSLKATKIKLDNKNQSLEVVFDSIDKTVNDNVNTINTHTTELNIQRDKISTLIADTTIEKDGNTTKLKDEYNKTVNKVDSMSSTIAKHETELDNVSGDIHSTNIKVNKVVRDLDGAKETISNVQLEGEKTAAKALEIEKTVNGLSSKVSDVQGQTGALETKVSEIKQSSDKLEVSVKGTSTFNMLQNSRPKGNLAEWTYTKDGNSQCFLEAATWDADAENWNDECFRSGVWFTGILGDYNGWCHLLNTSLEKSSFDIHKKYTIIFPVYTDTDCTLAVTIADMNSGNEVFSSGEFFSQNGYKWIKYTFIPTNRGNKPNLHIVYKSAAYQIRMYIPWINVYEGEMAIERHIESTRGGYSAITTFNDNGIRQDFEDGTYMEAGRHGLKYYRRGMSRAYQYITFTTKTERLRNGYWTWIQMPEFFKGKMIDTDFKVVVTVDDIDCNAYVNSGYYNGALRNFKAEVGYWESENCRLQVRCCIQKIGLTTHKVYGWDAASTDAGAVAGESAARVMIQAQM